MDYGNTIRERRAVLGVSQQDLADISGIGLRTIKLIESGNANPSIATLQRLGKALGLELVFQLRDTTNQG